MTAETEGRWSADQPLSPWALMGYPRQASLQSTEKQRVGAATLPLWAQLNYVAMGCIAHEFGTMPWKRLSFF